MDRRAFLTGLVFCAAAPAIVRAASLMPVKVIKPPPLVRGELGQWENVRFFDGAHAVMADGSDPAEQYYVVLHPSQYRDLAGEFSSGGLRVVKQRLIA